MSGDESTVEGDGAATLTGETLVERDAPASGGAPRAGTQIGRYVVRKELGAGAFGIVYEALDPELDRRVALKVLRAGGGSERRRARFAREGKAIAQLNHPNVVTVHDVGAADGRLFITMELVDGQPLGAWLDETPRAVAEIVDVLAQAARGLAAAHARGIVHRDFKPDNVLVGRDGRVRVADFGLARISDAPEDRSDDEDLAEDALAKVTHTGTRLGTPAYMAPEQLRGADTDARCDQFAFGVTLHEALTGVRPFAGTDVTTLTENVLAGRRRVVAPDRAPPRALAAVIDRCLAAAPAARFASMEELLAALQPPPARRRGPWIVVGGLTAAVIAAGVIAWPRGGGGDRCRTAGAPLAAAWSPKARVRIADAFDATGAPYAGASWTRTAARLDRWGDAWVTARIDTCRASDERRAAAQIVCLDGQLRTLDGVLAKLGVPDRELVARAAEIPSKLPPPSACEYARGTGDPAAGEALRAELADLRAEAASLVVIPDPMLQRAQEAVAAAKALDDDDLRADAGLVLGRMLRARSDAGSGPALFDAAVAAEAAGRDDLTVQAWAEWLFFAATTEKPQAEVAPIVARAEEALHRAGDDPALAAVLRNNQGNVLFYAREDAKSLPLFREALRLYEEAYGPDDAKVGYALDNLANVLGALASQAEEPERKPLADEAVATAERAVQVLERALGPEHPSVGRALQGLATTLRAVGLAHKARAHLERALALISAGYGEDSPRVIGTLFTLANLDIDEGRLDAAIANTRRVLAIAERISDDPERQHESRALLDLGDLLLAAARPVEAMSYYDRGAALAMPKSELRFRRGAALARLDTGDTTAALRMVREVVAAEAERYAAGDRMRARGMLALARAELASGARADATATLAKVERIIAGDPEAAAAVELTAGLAIARAELLAAKGKKVVEALLPMLDGCAPASPCDLWTYGARRRIDALRGDD